MWHISLTETGPSVPFLSKSKGIDIWNCEHTYKGWEVSNSYKVHKVPRVHKVSEQDC